MSNVEEDERDVVGLMQQPVQIDRFCDDQLECFRHWQRVSFSVLGEVAGRLAPGVTERDATRWAMEAYRREGADRFFHLPVALIGPRTTLPDPWSMPAFWPTDQVARVGDAVILDASPIFDGHVVDTAISFSVGEVEAQSTAMADDLRFRDSILDAVRAAATFREIAVSVDTALVARGDRNCHQLHPEGVLGHRVVRLRKPGDVPPPDASGFDQTVLSYFIDGIAAAHERGSPPPTWTGESISDHRPAPGLWAVEPHLGRGDIGVKWEEILVIEERDAYWLDDQVPHLGHQP